MAGVNVAYLITVKTVRRVCRSIKQPNTQALHINCKTVGVKTIQIEIFSVAHEFIKHVDQLPHKLFAENDTSRVTSDLDETLGSVRTILAERKSEDTWHATCSGKRKLFDWSPRVAFHPSLTRREYFASSPIFRWNLRLLAIWEKDEILHDVFSTTKSQFNTSRVRSFLRNLTVI